jgi:hypothetical protein
MDLRPIREFKRRLKNKNAFSSSRMTANTKHRLFLKTLSAEVARESRTVCISN